MLHPKALQQMGSASVCSDDASHLSARLMPGQAGPGGAAPAHSGVAYPLTAASSRSRPSAVTPPTILLTTTP